jgi:hypothetical protein
MIRDDRVFFALSVLGIIVALFGVALNLIHNRGAFMPVWVNVAIYVSAVGVFIYQIVRRLRFGRPSTVAGLDSPQLWTVKIAILAAMAILFAAIMSGRLRI